MTTINLDTFAEHLRWAEGSRSYPYECTAGKLTIGVGRNLEAKGLSDDEIQYLLDNDIADTIEGAETLPYWENLCGVRQLVVADMIFNLGLKRFKGFVNTNKYLLAGDYAHAADEMVDSKWYRQTGRRAIRLVAAMRTGIWK